MPSSEHLALHLSRLKPAEIWANGDEGLCFVFLKGGAGRCICKSITHTLGASDILVFNSRAGTKLQASENTDLVFGYFTMCLEHLFPLFADQELALVQKVLDAFKTAQYYSASRVLTKEWQTLIDEVSPQFNMKHRGQLLNVAGTVLSEEFKKVRRPSARGNQADEQMIQNLEKLTVHEIRTLLVSELAIRFKCSTRQLNRFFQRYFGLSVRALRMEMRLLKAVSLLRNPEFKIINVAEECDFNHLGLFNTCFKRRFGVSPGNWRKSPLDIKTPPPEMSLSDVHCQLLTNGLCPWRDTSQKSKPAARNLVARI